MKFVRFLSSIYFFIPSHCQPADCADLVRHNDDYGAVHLSDTHDIARDNPLYHREPRNVHEKAFLALPAVVVPRILLVRVACV